MELSFSTTAYSSVFLTQYMVRIIVRADGREFHHDLDKMVISKGALYLYVEGSDFPYMFHLSTIKDVKWS